MQVQKVEYGSTVRISATFKDSAGVDLVPSAAQVVISFTDITTRQTTRATITLPQGSPGNPWVATWNSAAAWRGAPAFWNARATGAENAAAFGRIDFDFNEAALPD